MYINANWPLALYGGPGVWIDESPGNFINGNYGAEHNFRITPSGTGSVAISADGGGTFATVTTSGWYNFQMTFQKGQPTDLVTTVMTVFDSNGNSVGATTVYSNSPGGPLYSQDLAGSRLCLDHGVAERLGGGCAGHRRCPRGPSLTGSCRLSPGHGFLSVPCFIRDHSVDGRS